MAVVHHWKYFALLLLSLFLMVSSQFVDFRPRKSRSNVVIEPTSMVIEPTSVMIEPPVSTEPHLIKFYHPDGRFSVMDASPLCFEQSGTQRHMFSTAQLKERCLDNNSRCTCQSWNCADYFHLGQWPTIETRLDQELPSHWIPGTTMITSLCPSSSNIYHNLNQLIGGWHVSFWADMFNLTKVDRVFIGTDRSLPSDSWTANIIRAIWPGFDVSVDTPVASFNHTLSLRKQVSLLSDAFPFSFESSYLNQALGATHSICFERVVLTGLSIFPRMGLPGKCNGNVTASTEAFQARIRSYVGKPPAHVARRKLVFGRRLKANSARTGVSSFFVPTEEAKLLELLTLKCALHNYELIVTGFSGSFRQQYDVIEDAAIFVSIHGTILLNACLFMPCNATVLDIVGSGPKLGYFTNGLETGVRYVIIKVEERVNHTDGVFLSSKEWTMLEEALDTAMQSSVR